MIYCLGPKGSYSEMAAKVFSKILGEDNIVCCNSIYDVFQHLENSEGNSYGVVPSENSIEGSVSLTQDLLLEFYDKIKIYGELDVNINHCLVGYNREKIKRIYSHPQALAQCRKYIKKHNWEVIPVSSTAEAVKLVRSMGSEEVGAIASKEAAKLYNLKVLEEGVQDYKNNTTRFILIGKKGLKMKLKGGGIKKSTVILKLIEDRPGALYEILKVFNDFKVNLTRIESRPSKEELGNYIFYIDYITPEKEGELIERLKRHVAYIKHMGSYKVFSRGLNNLSV
ncbi:MAG TPA: prephenate dehydratase [Methanothermococcus okinawensis]|uniref:prephenate dehydratase n=1 Tax=Methanothermococcus okinawensis TaxID=155863 RepID=A0A832ZJL3_9EURY|nr:prephenate dehydratase [Methanothermococcus okinawensis]HIP91366.1 prephenate dehydratase [Methanothermococcus okinawensis]